MTAAPTEEQVEAELAEAEAEAGIEPTVAEGTEAEERAESAPPPDEPAES